MPATKLTNPAKNPSDSTRLNINIDEAAFRFFFRGCLAGDRGSGAALVNHFFIKLHAAALADNIPSSWDPDVDHYAKLERLINRLNFDERPAVAGPFPAGPTRARRTNNQPPKRQQKPRPPEPQP